MKKIFLFLVCTAALVAASCESFLDQQPESELSADNFWQTEDDIRAGIAGMYDGIQGVISSRYIEWGEARSDNFTNGGTGITSINFALNGLTADMGEVNWDQLYATINRANLAIKNLPLITGGEISEAAKNNFLGQAYAMRAYSHFLGTKVWGGIPLMLEPVTDRDFKPQRTAAEEVLQSVIEDLNIALELVDPNNINVYEINTGGILCMLTEAYMWQQNYQEALESSDRLLALDRYSLAQGPDEWKMVFTDPANSDEAIWSMYWSFEEDGSNALAARIGSSTNTSPFILDLNLLSEWQQQENDFRRYLTYDTLEAVSTGAVQDIWKYYPPAPDGLVASALPPANQAEVRNSLYRLSDMMLLRAEAFNQLDNTSEAVSLLNDIRIRAGLDPVTADMFANKEELENAILKERQFELFAEGKRWFDLRRTGKVVEVMDPLLRQRQEDRQINVIGFGDPGFILFPISRDALNENPNLEQNPPYSR
ncbi:RagB/SusD family nutrient uptake outer membrane protein [Sinomicrobium weinanense]|uniref:RagB/SusD family nutrient uptake outer membrane protein n=1 Tax=Sinomicrobium weinanense TaxID=2842200 RepID=A0A926JQC7_9FLAO|nr:RagB/SusD family nutrient uptake outer membrane protein [Sinomicrobium weinanense]MBC9795542.1 RagB/SusD family nutrient uptake outer membrane protein [Sinomicrobium weinanense]MBU3123311.1 RagB/SusD family nutrient uptake outer membrane protein [Sinomicrobium weinanense]